MEPTNNQNPPVQPTNSFIEPVLTPQDMPSATPLVNQPVDPVSPIPTPSNGPSKNIIILLVVVILLILFTIAAFFVYRTYVAGNQTQAPTAIPTIMATATPYIVPTLTPISSASASASPSTTPATSAEGKIIGTICYPSEGVPAGKVIAKDTAKNTTISFDNPVNNTSFSISLPAGSYKLKYQPNSGTVGYYTNCTGSEASCQNNTTKRASIITTVIPGQSSSGVKICDYYYTAGMEPDF